VNVVLAMAIVLLLAAVAFVVTAPLRRRPPSSSTDEPQATRAGRAADEAPATPDVRLGDLEAAREAKYREIRDAELDFRTGKLSREDYDTLDAELRAEALAILDELERATRAS
jgi:hypothetical protein